MGSKRQMGSTLRLNTDEAEQLVDDDLTSLTSTTNNACQSLVEQDWDLVDIIAEGVDVVQQVEDRDDRGDRCALWQDVTNARQQVGVLTESTQKIATVVWKGE